MRQAFSVSDSASEHWRHMACTSRFITRGDGRHDWVGQAVGEEVDRLREQERAILVRMEAIRNGEGLDEALKANSVVTSLLDERATVMDTLRSKRAALQAFQVPPLTPCRTSRCPLLTPSKASRAFLYTSALQALDVPSLRHRPFRPSPCDNLV